MTEVERMEMEMIKEQCFISIDEVITHPPVAISYKTHTVQGMNGLSTYETPLGTYGNFSFIQAPPKSLKTFFVSLLASVYLSDSNKFGGKLKGNREGREMVHIDTEQGDWHSQRVFRRIADMNFGYDTSQYHTFALRRESTKSRVSFIEYYLDELEKEGKKIGLLILDGIADLVSDVNNIEESSAIVQRVMRWSVKYDCHIITVIHSNFGSSKPTGHLGSFLEKKSECQIELERNEQNKGWVDVSCKRSRNTPFENFSFKLNSLGLPEIIDMDDVYKI